MMPPIGDMLIRDNPEFGSFRIMVCEEEPWFVAKDVAEALGLTWNGTTTIKHVPEEWRGVISGNTPSGEQDMLCLSEQGLYFFLARSDKPMALPFQKWLAGDVLPSIRKYGLYATPMTIDAMIADPDTAILLLQTLKTERLARVEAENRAQMESERAEYALKTKAQIGSRREATAMATASAATRKVVALEDRLGEGQNYKQVKAIPWLLEEFEESRVMYQQVGKHLKSLSDQMGSKVILVPCHEYPEGVKAYHANAINEFQRQLQGNLEILGKYRKRGIVQ